MTLSILITGGTGSFGRAYAQAMLERGADRVCILSRGEHAQADMRRAMNDERLRFFIGDVRDRDRLRRAMEGCDYVIHAAALKRIEVGAYDPIEMVKTNVMGAINVIEAAQDAAVRRVVALSTDKAVEPISPYGHSKAMAEALFLQANATTGRGGPTFAVTRYGNVWWSRGSVGPLWRSMIEHGATTVPCTDPACTRFFMTMDQAVRLVIETMNAILDGLVLPEDMPAYRLADLASAMGVGFTLTGLPRWEKLHESITEGQLSRDARRMTVNELKKEIARATI